MSKLNGMQIFELLSNVNDNLIVESVSPALLAGGAAATAVGTTADAGTASAGTASTSAGTASAVAKTGFAAWLARGGWILLLAAAVTAIGIHVGSFLLLDSLLDDLGWPDLPHVTETSPADTGGGSDSEESEMPTEESAETPTEAVTEEETDPPIYVEDFGNTDLLSLFSAEQGILSVGEDGALVVKAQWEAGDENFSTLCFDPRAVMEALGETDPDARGALLLKIRRVKTMVDSPTAHPGTELLGYDRDVSIPVYAYRDAQSEYEYIVVELNASQLYKWEDATLICMEWLGLEGSDYGSEGRSMTVREIFFYGDIWEAFFAVEEKLSADGVSPPALKYESNGKTFGINKIRVPFLFLKPEGPNGDPIRRVREDGFSGSATMQVALLHEGFESMSNRSMSGNEQLRAVYLPDSLTELEGGVFSFCPELTRVRVGRGMEFIDRSAFNNGLMDIDYNGTMAEWCEVERDGARHSLITVHCLDGDILYAATEPDYGQAEAKREEIAWKTPMALAEGQVTVGMESAYVTLTHKTAGERTVVLRWALTRDAEHPGDGYDAGAVFYFDVIDPTDGSILYVFDREESLTYTREEGSSLFMIQGGLGEGLPQTATLFLTNYGYSDGKSSFTVRTTHFRLELTEEGEVTVNRAVDEKLADDVTISCPVTGTADLGKIRRVFTDIETYMAETYGLSNLKPARLLLVTRPHGDSAFFGYLGAPQIENGTLGEQKLFLDVTSFNSQSLEHLYERYGVYDVLE